MVMLRLFKTPVTRADFYLTRAAASADAAQAANDLRVPEAEEAFRVLERLWLHFARIEKQTLR